MLSRRFYLTVVVIAGLAIIFTSHFDKFSSCYGANKPPSLEVNESGTIVISGATKSSTQSFKRTSTTRTDAQDLLCEVGMCVDIYPKDGKIEGRRVSELNPTGINNSGQIVGLCVFEQSAGKFPFIRDPNGNLWIFKTPSSSGQGEFTDISDSGNAVGFYRNDTSKTKTGFLMNSQRKWVMDIELPVNPCPSTRSYLHTQPNGINNEGEIVGNFGCTENAEDAVDPVFKGNGFYRSPDGTFYRVQYENASRTVAGKISNVGVIFGYYVADQDTWIPFAAMKDDVIKPIVP